jgi:hypothetical protein
MTAATATLPTPTVTYPRSAYADMAGRIAKITYTLTEATAEMPGTAVIVTCAHNKDRKAFTASIQPVKVEQRNGYTTTTFMGFSGVQVCRKPVARFSKGAFAEFVAQTPSAIEVMVDLDPQIAALFTDPEASTKMFGRD